ncbi:polysaccharide lyase [uncultured Mucilaginibacter sp.]|uniref:polysaccharide lyase n=1 Tax=uncultured Mucilaginibacter sp. TaxID=797541 RepID=UPI0025EF4735|nr:polysaccharide lyase [uncultured Mucilaginibacter sp.]
MDYNPVKYLCFVALLFIGNYCKAQLPVHDDFEGPTLSKLWDTSRLVMSAVTMQSAIVHSGHGAIKITLHTGDKYEAGNDSSKVSERDELMEARNLVSKENNSYEYAFSMFIPADFPIVPTRLVIAQWKQYCNNEAICGDDSPVLALRYTNGILQITTQTGLHRTVVYQTKDDIRNKWTSFRFQTHFTRTDSGFVKSWINDEQVLDYKGKTCYGSERGYNNNSYLYFKMGLYRDKMEEPMTIYIDDYSKRKLDN